MLFIGFCGCQHKRLPYKDMEKTLFICSVFIIVALIVGVRYFLAQIGTYPA